ncbi:MAG: BamA/TamA family outer membrane protein [Myxococcota bacterium]|nr:BamA/TamA family outer membrane protein [Myxococcota bacterium]
MPSRWLLVVMILALGCGGSSVQGPPRATWIKKIKLEGNSAIDDDDVVPHLALERTRRGGRAVDHYEMSLDTERVRQAYVRKGFFDAKVFSKVIGETGPQTVVFAVIEGPRGKARVSITGLPPEVPLDKARALVPLRENGPFDYEVYDLAKEQLTKLIESAGYPYVELDAAVTVDKGIAIARYSFEVGPRCTFGEITLIGVAKGRLTKAVKNRFEFRTGDTFSTAALEATQKSLYEMGRFSTVHIEPDLSGDQRVIPVKIVVTHGGRGELRLGGGGGYDSIAPEVRVRGGISHIPKALPHWTFGVDARVALAFRELIEEGQTSYEWRVRVLGTGRRIDLFRPKITGDVGAGWDYLSFEAYTMTGPIAQLGITFPLAGTWLQLRVGWSMAYQFFTSTSAVLDDPAIAAELNIDKNRRLASYQQAVVADLRDSPTNTTKGAYFSLRVAEGTPFAGGEYSFLQLSPDVRLYYPLGPFVFAVHGRGGAIIGDVPMTERYFAGGATSQRGFPFRQLAPSVSRVIDGETQSVLVGGTSALETSAEIRAIVGTIKEIPIVASVFLDAADVFATNGELGDKPLHFAAGIGAGVIVGGFKIRLDIGHRLNRKGPNDPNYEPGDWVPNTEFHFGIGDAF